MHVYTYVKQPNGKLLRAYTDSAKNLMTIFKPSLKLIVYHSDILKRADFLTY